MNPVERPRGYRGSYVVGFLFIAVVTIRTALFYRDQTTLRAVVFIVVVYAVLYSLEPWLSRRMSWFTFLYFLVQMILVAAFSLLRPFLDFQTILYLPLCMQAFRAYPQDIALRWSALFFALLSIPLLLNMGLQEGLALTLLDLAMLTFLISYDFYYLRTQSHQLESQQLLSDLQTAHRLLQESAAQTNELAAARERNRLARDLHDSVSQTLFSISLTARSTRLLLERDPARVPLELERLKEMTAGALNQLRSLIAELHPH